MKEKVTVPIFVFLVALGVVVLQLHLAPPPTLDEDSDEYLRVGYELYTDGVFTDGGMTDENGKGMFFAPAFPAFLAGLMVVSEPFAESARCVLFDRGWDSCGPFSALVYTQAVLAAITAFLVWLSATVITERKVAAWLAMILALGAEAYAYFAGIMMTETLTFLFFTGANLAAAASWKRKSPALWMLAGVLLGAAALTRPGFAYLLYGALPALIVAMAFLRTLDWRRRALIPLLFLVGYGLAAGPWMIRNFVTFGDLAISKGYAGYIFVQRASFNRMSWDEWRASFIYGLPDFGDSLAGDLFPPERFERLDYANPEGYYQLGNRAFRDDMLEEAGDEDRLLGYLIEKEVLGNPGKHIAVTFSLLWRGVWVSKYWGMVAIPLFLAVFFAALRRRWGSFILYSLPGWYMAGFHAFTSVGVVRYNLILVPCLAIGASVALLWAYDLAARRFRKQDGVQ